MKLLKRKIKLENSEKIKKQKGDIVLQRVKQQFGDYTICGLDNENELYLAKCNVCGAERKMSISRFDSIKDFKCHKHYKPIKYDDSYIGKKYNYLEVIDIIKTESGERKFSCKCVCGSIKTIVSANVTSGAVKSCGCMRGELLSTHGLSGTRLYRIWKGMISRCYDEKSVAYENYGGRGISICDEWLNDDNGLQNFVNWATSHGYSDNLTIEIGRAHV